MSRDDGPGPEVTMRLGYLLKHAQLRMNELSTRALEPYNVNGRELAVLVMLAGRETTRRRPHDDGRSPRHPRGEGPRVPPPATRGPAAQRGRADPDRSAPAGEGGRGARRGRARVPVAAGSADRPPAAVRPARAHLLTVRPARPGRRDRSAAVT